jgi:primosomal protein N' (replication factor Y)
MPPELLADVALRATIPGADPVFTYRVPPALRGVARPGLLVWAPLRRQRVQGIILDLYAWETDQTPAQRGLPLHETPAVFRPDPEAPPDADAPVIRDLADIADPDVALTPAQVRLARWLSDSYRAPLYDCLALMLPPGVAQDAEPTWRATAAGLAADLGALPERERAVLYLLRQRGEQTEHALRQALRGSDSELRETYRLLAERGLAVRGALLSGARARPRVETLVRLTATPAQIDGLLADLARAPKQRAVVAWLAGCAGAGGGDGESGRAADSEAELEGAGAPPPVPLTQLYAATGANRATLRALEARGVLELSTREVRRDPLAGEGVPPDTPPPLTLTQERVWREIAAALERSAEVNVQRSAFDGHGIGGEAQRPGGAVPQHRAPHAEPKTFLLHGVTGSGKTEIYLRAIGRTLRQGRQALVLVPEIALTAQLVRRFAARFPGRLAVLHSGLRLGERYDEWRRLRRGEAGVAIGSRSAAFAPLPELGLIIVDEEHEPTYKHDGSPRYHARDVAARLAEITGSVLILGSATPSVESYHAAHAGQTRLLELPERVGMHTGVDGLPRSQPLPLPPVSIVDMRRELQAGNRSIFSRPLQQALSGALRRGEQAILFLNRRGAASFVMCRDCGHVVACPNCSTPLALHYLPAAGDGRREARSDAQGSSLPSPAALLICHACNHREDVPRHCPNCWGERIKSFGVGTQRVVEEVETLYPGVRALRWDRDSAGRRGDHARLLDRFLRHDADVLVGTQMIAKGLDLPLVSVVGVIAADTALHLPDFRSGERTFQLLTQVAGRAGRRSAGSQVVIQTYNPEHYALRAAQEHDYRAFYVQEIAFRRQAGYPPFSRLVRFITTGASDERCQRAAAALADDIRRAAAALELRDWSLIGPAPAFFHRQRSRFRWHVILRAADPMPLLAALRLPPGWAVDVDPVYVL